MVQHTLISMPIDALSGEITVPGDKSISHRALMLGAIAEGVTTVSGCLTGADCLATLHALQNLGVTVEQHASEVRVRGVGKHGLSCPESHIDCGNSGTSMRLLAGLLSAQAFDTVLSGDHSLSKRPMQRVCDPLMAMGARLQSRNGCAPIEIKASRRLRGLSHVLRHPSAQIKSALLLAGLYADGTTDIESPWITRDHTERMLQTFSYPISWSEKHISIIGGYPLIGTHVNVPGDFSSAAFFIVAATLLEGATLRLNRVGVNPGRIGLLHILKKMGANISLSNQVFLNHEPVADIVVTYAPLKGIEILEQWVSLSIDEFPVILIAAACAEGKTYLKSARELRHKESDRIASMREGLLALGIEVEELDDGLVVQGGTLRGGRVDCQYDHRIAMAFLIAGAVAKEPVIVKQCTAIATSFPTFVKQANDIGLHIRTYHNEL